MGGFKKRLRHFDPPAVSFGMGMNVPPKGSAETLFGRKTRIPIKTALDALKPIPQARFQPLGGGRWAYRWGEKPGQYFTAAPDLSGGDLHVCDCGVWSSFQFGVCPHVLGAIAAGGNAYLFWVWDRHTRQP
ncbi:MAG: hypothetical protein AUJ52_05880 [Elusimicrobia bacterium CG1_02_63_36]|nr:MAG: hypothetical protein AUJ52_05880 [Elusimicrobia bacterium CG1_02_63_36]PIP84936.1 MAG: hypothetical protein COR54_01545 [Elusimicrobia bacterium CG22_combo_CG10-13_8_21_14_all_63_91]PJA13293.1 MAG: hypothetical protein COX66_15145 [Elusimicrobia bacterium CG_4_10_14_0_2_um_filter_63_34]PJB26125.1 MAG: hypothetical protein CO113_05125 [Elusimicrobia bacterium CG_4_9_14_3_um_filter_62_55]